MRNSPASFRNPTGGFTLLELMIATVVGAIILLVINDTYFTSLKLHNATNAMIDKNLVLQRGLVLVERDLKGLRLPGGLLSGSFQDTPTDSLTQEFADTRISPDFYTNTGEVDGWSGFSEAQIVTYFLAPTTDGSNTKNLVRAVTRNLLPSSTPETDEKVLLTGLSDAVFDYYDGEEWTTTWDSTQTSTLPATIRLTLTFASSAQTDIQPTVLMVPVMVTTKTTQKALVAAAASGGLSQ